MAVRRIKAGTTDVSITLRIVDSTDGTPETGVVFNTSGIDLWYRRDGATSTDITEATLSALNDAHSDGGFLHINDGWYRLDLPDAACASGVPGVQIGGTVTGMVVLAPYIELPVNTDADVYDRIGAPAGASIAADLAAIEAQTDDIGAAGAGLTAITNLLPAALVGGRIDANVGAISGDAAAADNLEAAADGTGYNLGGGSVVAASVTGAVGSVTGNVGGNVTGSVGSLAAQAKTDVNAEVVDALATDTYAEPGQGAPGATISLASKIGFLYKAWRNRHTQTATEYALYDDAGTTKDQEAAVSDDGVTTERGEVGTGA
jgi:hypothetical protein